MDKLEAIRDYLEDNDVEEISYDGCVFEVGNQRYLVLTDDEADDRWDEALDNYLEECIYPELPDNLVSYFDDEAWKRDARMDGRGHCLSHYDGCEDEYEGYYIYRLN